MTEERFPQRLLKTLFVFEVAVRAVGVRPRGLTVVMCCFSVLHRSTIERHLLSSATDPFSRAALSMEQVQPAEDIRRRTKEWMEQCADAAAAKQQEESVQAQAAEEGATEDAA